MSNLAKKIIEGMPANDKRDLISWAQKAYVIRNDENITNIEKVKKLTTLTRKHKIAISFIKSTGLLAKKHAWDERGWPARLALAGLTTGVAIAGSKMAGIASAGMGVGVPIYLLSSAGGALLGTIIEEINKD
tara:strand:- start:16018 stop:16413 length:396 start_codon:yes stop_codon:yes gene_type:complete